MLKSIGTTEWIIIGLIVLLLFGGKKIPELFRGLAESIREFKKAARDGSNESEKK